MTAVYTVWRPLGWRTSTGLRLGASEDVVVAHVPAVQPIDCSGYHALVHDAGGVRTAYYVVDGKLWGFGLMGASTTPCR